MVKLIALDPTQATGKVRELLAQVQAQLGMVPNMMRTMANSPAMLEGYLSFSNTLAGGVLSPQLREQIALAVAEINSCEYCLSAHTTIGYSHKHERPYPAFYSSQLTKIFWR